MKPLGLPIGSVRAILALLLVGAVVAGFLLDRGIQASDMVTLAGIVLTFYYLKRDGPSDT